VGALLVGSLEWKTPARRVAKISEKNRIFFRAPLKDSAIVKLEKTCAYRGIEPGASKPRNRFRCWGSRSCGFGQQMRIICGNAGSPI
jgi:hypothetical protein